MFIQPQVNLSSQYVLIRLLTATCDLSFIIGTTAIVYTYSRRLRKHTTT